MKTLIAALLFAFATAACGVESSSTLTVSGGSTPAATTAPVAVASGVHEVRCGCKIDGINHCGNYVDVGGTWVEIANPGDYQLGAMEWCAATEKVEATVAGSVQGDKITLSELTTL